jgi:hypothetical protein
LITYLLIFYVTVIFLLKGKKLIYNFLRLTSKKSFDYNKTIPMILGGKLGLRTRFNGIYYLVMTSLVLRIVTLLSVLFACQFLNTSWLFNYLVEFLNLLAFIVMLYVFVRVKLKKQFESYHSAALIHFLFFILVLFLNSSLH